MPSATLPADTSPTTRYYQPGRLVLLFSSITSFILGPFYFLLHDRFFRFIAVLFVISAVMQLAGYFGWWWELRPEGVFEHAPWRTRLIPYGDVHVVKLGNKSYNPTVIQYSPHLANTPALKEMKVNPDHRAAFTAALRELAPQAEFRT